MKILFKYREQTEAFQSKTMAQFKGDARDAKRARYGARVQEEMKEAFERKVKEMRDETNKSLHNMELGMIFIIIILAL